MSFPGEEGSTKALHGGHLGPNSLARPTDTLVVAVLTGQARGTKRRLGEKLSVGAARDNDLVLPDDTVSRHHCELVREARGILVESREVADDGEHGLVADPLTFVYEPIRVEVVEDIAPGVGRRCRFRRISQWRTRRFRLGFLCIADNADAQAECEQRSTDEPTHRSTILA